MTAVHGRPKPLTSPRTILPRALAFVRPALLVVASLLIARGNGFAGGAFTLRAPSLSADPASSVTVPVTFDSTDAVRAISFGIAHDPAVLSLAAIQPGPVVTTTDPDYFFTDVDPDEGVGGVVGILFSLSPPIFELPPGLGQHLVDFVYDTAPVVPVGTSTPLDFSSDIGDPPVEVLVAVRGQGLVPDTESGSLLFNPPPVANLAATLTDACEAIYSLTWMNPVTYSSIQVRVNGVLVQTLSGFSTSATVDLAAPGTFTIGVVGSAMGLAAEPALAPLGLVDTVPPPPSALSCQVDPDTCEVTVTWTNPAVYTAIEVSIDGTLVETLPGDATSTSALAGVMAMSICLVGLSDCGPTASACCQVACGVTFIRGDCNGDAGYDIADAVAGLNTLFSGGGPVGCEDACDANDDGSFDIADMVYILASLFSGGALPASPHPACGTDDTDDLSTCLTSPCL